MLHIGCCFIFNIIPKLFETTKSLVLTLRPKCKKFYNHKNSFQETEQYLFFTKAFLNAKQFDDKDKLSCKIILN